MAEIERESTSPRSRGGGGGVSGTENDRRLKWTPPGPQPLSSLSHHASMHGRSHRLDRSIAALQ
jgi:hypothetical protein